MGCEIPRYLGDEVPLQGSTGGGSSASARPTSSGLPRAGGGDSAGLCEPRPCAYACECAAAVGTSQAGAVHERSFEPNAAGRISPAAEALLGSTSVGPRVFLCERRRGGRRDHSAIHRKPEVGRPWGELQNYSAKRALSRLSAGRISSGFSRKLPTFSRNINPPPFRRWSFSPSLVLCFCFVRGTTSVVRSLSQQ